MAQIKMDIYDLERILSQHKKDVIRETLRLCKEATIVDNLEEVDILEELDDIDLPSEVKTLKKYLS